MGKRQHQKDKMYLTYTEWSTLYGGKKTKTDDLDEDENFRRLPFDHCCLSLVPFEHPYCDAAGHVFELEPILKFVKKFKQNPVTGKSLDTKGLFKLQFHKNEEGKYHCPVLFKMFTKHSHIVAVKTTGNVFSYEAIEQLNIKTRNWKDLLNDQPFKREDLITIQDPTNTKKFNLSSFYHIKNNIRVEDDDPEDDNKTNLKNMSMETKEILKELDRTYKPATVTETKVKPKADSINAAHYSTGAVAAGFTSTVMPAETKVEAAVVEEDQVRYEHVKKKGYVRLVTNFGTLNLELHCEIVPKTCENFLKHCLNGYYNGLTFHRSIRNFMIQGGDPTNTGKGGKSIWDEPFEDEIKPNLVHQGRGILSMANSGPNTNGSQFFITYRSCRHLDGKHTVFGKVVGGMETLNAMEQIEVDNKDRPIEDIIITGAQIFVNPYQEADEVIAAKRQAEIERLKEEALKEKMKNKKKSDELKVYRSGIGKYINPQQSTSKSDETDIQQNSKTKNVSYKLENFSEW